MFFVAKGQSHCDLVNVSCPSVTHVSLISNNLLRIKVWTNMNAAGERQHSPMTQVFL